MENFITKNKVYISLLLIIFLYLILSIYYITNSRVVGDGTFHLVFMHDFFTKGRIDGFNDHLWGVYGFPRFQQYTLNYPILYHALGTILYPFFQSKTVLIIDTILHLTLILTSSSFIYKWTKSFYRTIFISIFLSFSSLIISGGNNNLFLSTFVILSFLYLILYFQNKYLPYLVLYVLFTVMGFGAKQFFIFVFPWYFLLHFFMLTRRREFFSRFFLSNLLILLLVSPIIYFQIKTTGTLSTQTVEGWPIVDKVLSPRHIKGIEPWQWEIDKKVDINLLRKLSERHYVSINSGFNQLKTNFFDTILRWTDINNYSILPQILKQNLLQSFFIIFFIFSFIFYLKSKELTFTSVLYGISIFIPFIIIILFTKRIEYALFFPISMILFTFRYFPLSNKKGKVVLIISFFVFSIINTTRYIYSYNDFSVNNYMRSNVPIAYINETYSWIKKNVNDNDKILSSNTQDDPYYTNKIYFYDYRLWFLTEADLEKYLPYYQGFRYILVFKPNIDEDFDNWNIVPLNSPLLNDLLVKNKFFSKAYESEYFIIFKKKG